MLLMVVLQHPHGMQKLNGSKVTILYLNSQPLKVQKTVVIILVLLLMLLILGWAYQWSDLLSLDVSF